jgi:hypothetical protein
MTAEELERFMVRAVRTMRRLSPGQRDVVLLRILESDQDLASALPALRATIAAAHRIRKPLRRDGLS